VQEIVGFAAFHRVMDEAELCNIAVNPAHQRKGVARGLLTAGISIMRDAGTRRLFLEVRASNQAARTFYAAMSFQWLYKRRGYYHNPEEDALVMACDVVPSISSPNHTPANMLE
jgi:ribosomal-protein-alanine N-acetyltransferase